MKINDLPSMERPQEKFLNFGSGKLSDAELLAIIIKTGTNEKSSVEIIQELMNKYNYEEKGISFLNDLSIEEIQKIKGLGKVKAIQLKVISELVKRMSEPGNLNSLVVNNPEVVSQLLMEDMRHLKQEMLVTVMLTNRNTLIKVATNTIGGLNSNVVEVREIFKEPIKHSASKIILAHNHPSGNPYPSDSDVNFTNRIYEAGKIMGIELVDHIIIGDGVFSSLKELRKF